MGEDLTIWGPEKPKKVDEDLRQMYVEKLLIGKLGAKQAMNMPSSHATTNGERAMFLTNQKSNVNTGYFNPNDWLMSVAK